MSERNQLIDSLRGFSMIVMILTHATAYFPSDRIAFTLWNWSNFAVPIFLFCSVYLFIKKYEDKPLPLFAFLRKRFVRLLVPYYLFLPLFLIVLLIVSPEKVTIQYILQSIFIIGGVDINWLVLLFLMLTIILPIFIWTYQKARVLFWFFFIASFACATFLLVGRFDFSYKFIMWLPWSLVLFFTLLYIRFEKRRKVLIGIFLVSSFIFLTTYFFQIAQHHSTVLIHNKYPPNLLYISFGLSILLFLSLSERVLFSNAKVLKIIKFFSNYSYSIYFIHYTFLIIFAAYIKTFQLNWLTLFIVVLVATVLLQYGYNLAKHMHSQK